MPTTAITRENKFLTTTLQGLVKEETDALHIQSSWFEAAEKKFGKGKPVWDGGDILIEPITVAEHSQMTPFVTGYEPVNLSVTDTEVPIQWLWFSGVMPIVISKTEEMQNSGPNALVKIVDRRAKNVMAGFKRKFVKQTLIGGISGFSLLNTLNGVDSTSGFLEENAVGSQTNSIGGFSKSTYATLPGGNNQAYDCLNSFNTYGLASLAYINTKIQPRRPEGGKHTAWLFSEAFNQNVKRSVQAYERFVGGGGEKVDPGKMYSLWDGVPCYTEVYMPNAGTTTTATPISAYALSMEHCKTMWHPEGFFKVDEFVDGRPTQAIRAALVWVMCQNTINHFGSQGVIVKGDTF